jgi:hypothetical protein
MESAGRCRFGGMHRIAPLAVGRSGGSPFLGVGSGESLVTVTVTVTATRYAEGVTIAERLGVVRPGATASAAHNCQKTAPKGGHRKHGQHRAPDALRLATVEPPSGSPADTGSTLDAGPPCPVRASCQAMHRYRTAHPGGALGG